MIPTPKDFDPEEVPFNETNFPKGSYFMWRNPESVYQVIGDWDGSNVKIRNLTSQGDYTFSETFVSDHKRVKQMQTK